MSTYSHAAKFTAVYIQGKYGYGFKEYLLNDPQISSLHLIAYSGDKNADGAAAENAATQMVGHISSLGFELEDGANLTNIVEAVKKLIEVGEDKVSALSKAINDGFIFQDEIEDGGEEL